MKWTFALCISLLVLSGCASQKNDEHPSGLVVTEINPTKDTAITKQNLLHLAQVYELSPFLYTKKVQIQSTGIPHSHPVLTLNTKNADYPKKILSNFLHEELHWWLAAHPIETNDAVKELMKIYPKVPVEKNNPASAGHIHLMVCYLEYKALSFYLGQKEARDIITQIMKKDKMYPWTYYQVLYKDYAVRQVVRKHKLLPPMLNLEANKKPAALLRKKT